MTIAAGTKLGPYEIAGAIGAGGMGEALLAGASAATLGARFVSNVESNGHPGNRNSGGRRVAGTVFH
jgi:hypothetical protein